MVLLLANLAVPLGSPIASSANILQNFWEDVLPSPLDSISAEVQ